jgi:hypothetical protein
MPDYPRITSLRLKPKYGIDQVRFYQNGEIGYWSQRDRTRVRERSILKQDFDAMPAETQKILLQRKVPIRYERKS